VAGDIDRDAGIGCAESLERESRDLSGGGADIDRDLSGARP
jgi:hypothetical protein